jgi:DNA adenine methylase
MNLTQLQTDKPLFPYYGGKQNIGKLIVSYIRNISHSVYCEPFCGGAAVLFAKDWVNPSNSDDYREVLNDTNQEIINLYRVCQTQYEKFLHLIEFTPYSEDEHRKAKHIGKNPQDYDELWRAWAFYVNISQSFNNTLNKNLSRGVKGRNHAATWHNKKTYLPQIMERLSKVYLSNCDALQCIKNWDSPNTLFYLDPPYPNTHQGHYSGYTQEDFEALIEVLKGIEGSFILSNYPNEAAPKDWALIEIEATMSAKKVKGGIREKRTECLWIVDKGQLPLLKLIKD